MTNPTGLRQSDLWYNRCYELRYAGRIRALIEDVSPRKQRLCERARVELEFISEFLAEYLDHGCNIKHAIDEGRALEIFTEYFTRYPEYQISLLMSAVILGDPVCRLLEGYRERLELFPAASATNEGALIENGF